MTEHDPKMVVLRTRIEGTRVVESADGDGALEPAGVLGQRRSVLRVAAGRRDRRRVRTSGKCAAKYA